MQKETGKVLLACALGAGIGSLVALELNQWLWWLGLIAGGLIGYFSYEWRAVVRAIPAAWKAANGVVVSWQFLGTNALLIMAVLWLVFWSTLPFMVTAAITKDINSAPGWCAFFVILGFFAGFLGPLIIIMVELGRKTGRSSFDDAKMINWRICPIFVIFWHLPRGIHWLWVEAPRFFRFCKRFAWEFFIRIHSERRLLCGVDAMLGAGIGYFAGSAIIGAVAGGLIGVANYALITERWLKPRGYIPSV